MKRANITTGTNERNKMSYTNNKLNVRTTEEILKKNVNSLQDQLVFANKRVASLADKLGSILAIHRDLEYHLQGIEIYISDIKELLDEKR
tara:strand:- start:65 stop:334 length:270 start_codon:yes stop_codon:yes gene_type:complete